MQRTYCCFIYIILVAAIVICWEFSAKSPFASFKGAHDKQDKGENLQSSQDINKKACKLKGLQRMDDDHEVGEPVNEFKRMMMIGPGSKPPKCEHKCRGCKPCIAVQVKETGEHLELDYANYEPEGWVCKCGSSFFIP